MGISSWWPIHLKCLKIFLRFALSDCFVESEGQIIDLFEKFCPNDGSKVVGLDWLNPSEYSINIFRVGDTENVTFKCKASIYPENATLCNCNNNTNCKSDRKRRDTTKVQVSTTIKLIIDGTENDARIHSLAAMGVVLINYGLWKSHDSLSKMINCNF